VSIPQRLDTSGGKVEVERRRAHERGQVRDFESMKVLRYRA